MSMNSNYMNSFLVQESIALMFVSLGLVIIGMGYGKNKSKDSLQLHRWIMNGATILTLTAIFFVMLPAFYIYYVNPANSFSSGFSILQMAHSLIGLPAVVLSAMYLLNDLPKPTKKWMRINAVLWIISIASGAIIYYSMPS